MTREIRLYVEGGGDGKDSKHQFRQAFGQLFRDVRQLARQNKVRWEIIACGSREAAFAAYKTALNAHRDAFNVLLVDSESAVSRPPWLHLHECDGWMKPEEAEDRHCHLMAQAMEAWFLADRQALAAFYGQGFNVNALPKQHDVEQIPKSQLANCLNKAARGTNKPKYHKIQHACKILERLGRCRGGLESQALPAFRRGN
ncbi:MAG TPA: DUF4276 family protein [Pirellulales bacterium]|nr:DUF4276 family protein [Pirellulales bacterium]